MHGLLRIVDDEHHAAAAQPLGGGPTRVHRGHRCGAYRGGHPEAKGRRPWPAPTEAVTTRAAHSHTPSMASSTNAAPARSMPSGPTAGIASAPSSEGATNQTRRSTS